LASTLTVFIGLSLLVVDIDGRVFLCLILKFAHKHLFAQFYHSTRKS
jgi:hypothetical protein